MLDTHALRQLLASGVEARRLRQAYDLGLELIGGEVFLPPRGHAVAGLGGQFQREIVPKMGEGLHGEAGRFWLVGSVACASFMGVSAVAVRVADVLGLDVLGELVDIVGVASGVELADLVEIDVVDVDGAVLRASGREGERLQVFRLPETLNIPQV